jgi:hypothetical protein
MRALLFSLLVISGCFQEYAMIPIEDPNAGALQVDRGGIQGRVCSPSGNTWVSGAAVWVTMDNGEVIQTQTDGDGRYRLADIPPGSQKVHVKKGSFSTSFPAKVTKNRWTLIASETCLSSDVKVAVVTGDFDHVESVLDGLGVVYDEFEGHFDSDQYVGMLRDWEELSDYDVVFFNCGMSSAWMDHEEEVTGNIRRFVEEGGSIYASDWAYYIVERTFPQLIDFYGDDLVEGDAAMGESGVYTGKINDSTLQGVLGESAVDLNFDLGSWVVAKENTQGTTLITGEVRVINSQGATQTLNVPLVVQAEDVGKVLYTSFHNEHQTTNEMEAILEQVVLSL